MPSSATIYRASATFTTDVCEAIATEYSGTSCSALPVNETEDGYVYPPRVRFELTEKASIRIAAPPTS